MNARTFILLKLLGNGEQRTIEELSEEYGVSDRLVRYIIDDCDFYLRSIGLPQIGFTDYGVTLNITPEQREVLLDRINNLDAYSYVVSASERRDYILLSMLCCTEPLKSAFFADLLNVSKSSIDKDIAAARQEIESYGLDINAMSGKGSYLSGDEIDIRYLYLKIISRYFEFAKAISGQTSEVQSFMERNIYVFVFELYLKKVLKIVEDVESEMKLKLSFLSLKDLCIYLIIMINRISLNRSIRLLNDYIDEIRELKTYEEADNICEKISKEFSIGISDSERAYVCLMLESAYYTATDSFAIKEWAAVQTAANELIDRVSERIGTNLSDDSQLVNALTLHLGLTSFKTHNKIPIVNADLENIRSSYETVFNAIKGSVSEIDKELFKGITDDDIAYITLHFQAAIERNKEKKNTYNIIVVCIHGYGTASLMKEMIVSHFRNITVKKIITQNNVASEDLAGIDFIVSSVDLAETRCPVVKVNTILKKQDQMAIEKVMNSIRSQNTDTNRIFIDDLMDIISSNTTINDKKKLQAEIGSYLNSLGIQSDSTRDHSLADYLTEEKIKIIDSVSDWRESVEIAGQMLVKKGSIDKGYITSIIESVESSGPYMVVDNGVALIHGDIDRYVNETDMSLLICKKGVNYGNRHFDPVHLILCLAAKDTYTHNRALNHFLEIISDYRENREKYSDREYITEKIREVSNSNELI